MNPTYHELQTHRRDSVFSQQDIADMLGTADVSKISRLETNPIHPQIELGLLYEILYQVPFATFFSGQKQLLISRLKTRIPNIIDELKCTNLNDLVNKKIGCLQDVLLTLNKTNNL